MAETLTSTEFMRLLGDSRVLSSRVLRSVEAKIEKLPAKIQNDSHKLAGTLVKSGIITHWQARRLLSGKSHDFYLGKYRLLELLGVGGMGFVYLAEHLKMHRLVAIKVLRQVKGRSKAEEQEIVARFDREAQAVAALQHPNIVQAFDFEVIGNVRYLVMEFVEGVDAAIQLEKSGPLHFSQAADYICQAAAGLQHAHDVGLVHRDVKPGNLLIDKNGFVKIADLGLVSCLPDNNSAELTVDQNKLGTVDYIAPEQALSSHDVDGRADIYSLGGTFYRLVSGQFLFPDMNVSQKLLAQQMRQPTPLNELVPELPDELNAVVAKMLAKDRNDRYSTMPEVIEALQPFAKRVTPPFDISIVRRTREEMEPFLRRGPESFDATDSSAPVAEAVLVAEEVSSSDLVAATDSFVIVPESSDSAMTSLSVGKNRTKSGAAKSKLAQKNATTMWIVGGLLAGFVALVVAAVVMQGGDAPVVAKSGGDAAVVATPLKTPPAVAKVLIIAVMPKPFEDLNGDGKIDGRDEYVALANMGAAKANISGYSLSDNDGIRHVFPAGTILESGAELQLFTGELNTAGKVKWGVWNDVGDEILLRNSTGETIDRQTFDKSKHGAEIVFRAIRKP